MKKSKLGEHKLFLKWYFVASMDGLRNLYLTHQTNSLEAHLHSLRETFVGVVCNVRGFLLLFRKSIC